MSVEFSEETSVHQHVCFDLKFIIIPARFVLFALTREFSRHLLAALKSVLVFVINVFVTAEKFFFPLTFFFLFRKLEFGCTHSFTQLFVLFLCLFVCFFFNKIFEHVWDSVLSAKHCFGFSLSLLLSLFQKM